MGHQNNFAAIEKGKVFDTFKSMPMPKEKDEDWRYTEIGRLKLEKFSPFASNAKIHAEKLSESLVKQGIVLIDINTAFEKNHMAQSHFLKNINVDKDKFAALSSAFFTSGIFLYVPKNVELKEPIKVSLNLDGQTNVNYSMIIVGENSKVDFVECYSNTESSNEQLNSCITEVFVNENSKINYHHLNSWTKNVYNVTSITGAIESNAEINWASACFGGRINRLRIDTQLNGHGSKSNNIGIFFGKDQSHIDITTNAYHNAQNTSNNILVDGILKDKSTSVYRGLIKIERQAQKTNSYLANHILKLSEKTVANSIPSLKIDANDVKASHEAAISQINEEQMFYLMARGIPISEAEELIAGGFFENAMQKITSEELKQKIRALIDNINCNVN